MKIMISGATGYIARKLIKRLKEEKHQIYAVVRRSSNITAICEDTDEIIYGDDRKFLFSKVQEIRPDLYINLAGKYYGIHNGERLQEMIEANITFPSIVADAFVQAGGQMIIHTASWQQSYDGCSYDPINYYAATKQAFEDILKFYAADQAAKIIVLQLFETYGADDTRNKVFNYVRRLHDGEEIDMSPGMQKLYFCYITDVVAAYLHSVELLKEQKLGFMAKYAVRPERAIALREFVEQYESQMPSSIQLNWGKRSYMKREIMDASGMGEVLPGWYAKVSYEEGIKLCRENDMKNSKKRGKDFHATR